MNARESENYLAISRSSSASKSVEMFWAEIYWGRLFLGPNLVSFNRTVVLTGTCFIQKIYAPSSYLHQGKNVPFSPSPLHLNKFRLFADPIISLHSRDISLFDCHI